jgi:hypothetical protein
MIKIKLAGYQDKWDNFRDPRESHNEKHFDNGLQVGLLPLPGNLFTKNCSEIKKKKNVFYKHPVD